MQTAACTRTTRKVEYAAAVKASGSAIFPVNPVASRADRRWRTLRREVPKSWSHAGRQPAVAMESGAVQQWQDRRFRLAHWQRRQPGNSTVVALLSQPNISQLRYTAAYRLLFQAKVAGCCCQQIHLPGLGWEIATADQR